MIECCKKLKLACTVALAVVVACGGEAGEPRGATPGGGQAPVPQIAATRVAGEIRATSVVLDGAEFGGELAIYEGDGWGFNPSLWIALFLEDRRPPEGRSFTVSPEDGVIHLAPQVHYRWRDPQTGTIQTEARAQGFRLELEFGAVEGDCLPGRIEFSVPGEGTAVAGPFRARIREVAGGGG